VAFLFLLVIPFLFLLVILSVAKNPRISLQPKLNFRPQGGLSAS